MIQSLLLVCLVTGSLSAADDPFVGQWKVNPSRSKLIDEMKVEAAGPNTFKLTFAGTGGETETIVANGTDQPGLQGTTFSVTVKGPDKWEVVRKMKGRTLLRAIWTLSEDGQTLHDAFTQYLPDGTTLFSTPLPDGSTLFMPYVYERTAGKSGVTGTWDSESAKVSAKVGLQIQRDEEGALSFKRSDEDTAKKIKFDGNDSRRVNERRLEITSKVNGKVTGTRQIELSPDLETLTITDREVNLSRPTSVLVFDRDVATFAPVLAPAAGRSSYRVTLELPDGTHVSNYSVTVKDEGDATAVTGNWPPGNTSGEVTDSMTLEKKSLLLRHESFRRLPKSGETSKPATIDLDFRGNGVTGATTSASGETKPVSIELGAPIYPGGVAIDVVIGCLPLAEGYTTTYRYWDTQALKEGALHVRVVGTERVTVAAGAFDCWKVELTTAEGSEKGTVWITKDSRTPIRSSGSKVVGRNTISSRTELIP